MIAKLTLAELAIRQNQFETDDEDRDAPVIIRCYRSISNLSVPRAAESRWLRPISDGTQCPSYLTDLDFIPPPEILEVNEHDIPPAIRKRIKPSYHIMF